MSLPAIYYDTESFQNLFLVCLYDGSNYRDFAFHEGMQKSKQEALAKELCKAMQASQVLVSFNGMSYDNLLLHALMREKKTPLQINSISSRIIAGDRGFFPRRLELSGDEIDVCAILDRKASLKAFQARMQLEKIHEFEGDFTKPIAESEIPSLVEYCHYDCYSLALLYATSEVQKKLAVKRALASKYGVEFNLSESDLAEKILSLEIATKLGAKSLRHMTRLPKMASYGHELLSPKITFQTPYLQELLALTKDFHFEYNDEAKMEARFARKLEFMGFSCNLGIGGLHSVDISRAIRNPQDGKLINYDVASYYPSTIDLLSIAPSGIESAFLDVYRPLIKARLTAKANGDKATADALKIVLNATFGRLKYKNSALYNPASMLAVTLNCQFFYLMLIERLLTAKIEILQVNTDGILVYPKLGQLEECKRIAQEWQSETEYTLESEVLDGVLVKDSNNYAWIKDGKVVKEKGKGFRTKHDIFHDCSLALCVGHAVQSYFFDGKPVEDTIKELAKLQDWRLFAVWQRRKIEGKYKIRRYCYSIAGEKIEGVSGYVQLLPDATRLDFKSLDLERYQDEAQDVIDSLESKPKARKSTRSKSNDMTATFDFDTEIESEMAEPETVEPEDNLPSLEKSKATRLEAFEILIDQADRHFLFGGYFDGSKPVPTVPKNGVWSVAENGMVDHEPIAETSHEKYSFIALNPVEAWALRKEAGNFKARKAITIEFDTIPIAEQWERLSKAPYSVICFSGGKSLHAHIRFARELTEAENTEIEGLCSQVFGDSDNSVFRINQFVRLPGGTRYEKDGTKKHQAILAVSTRQDPIAVMEWLRKQPNPHKPTSKKKKRSLASNLKQAEFAFELINSKLGDDWKYSQGSGGLLHKWVSFCPCQDHDKRNDSEFAILIYDSGLVATNCFHNTCSDVKASEFLRCLGFADDEIEILARFRPQDEPEKTSKMIDTIEAVEVPETQSSKDAYTRFSLVKKGECLIYEAYTGAGKTRGACLCLIDRAKLGLRSTIFCGTIIEARNTVGILKTLGAKDEWISFNVSKKPDSQDESESTDTQQDIRLIAVTTYGYVGRKGHTASGYTIFHELVEDSLVIFDEAKTFFDISQVRHLLAMRYLLTGAVYHESPKCPRDIRQGDCDRCQICYGRQDKKSQKTSQRSFRKEIDFASISDYQRKPDFGCISWSEITDYKSYLEINGSVYYKDLSIVPNFPGFDQRVTSEFEFMSHFLRSVHNAHVRMEFPRDASKNPVFEPSPEIVEIPPKQACMVPVLCGIDILPFKQLGKTTVIDKHGKAKQCKGAQSIIFMSATLPAQFQNLLEEYLEGFEIAHEVNKEVTATFSGRVLKTSLKVGRSKVAQVAIDLAQSEKWVFVVMPTEAIARKVYEDIRNAIPGKVKYFVGSDFNEILASGTSDAQRQILVTYGRSGITKGSNYPEYQVAIVDCGQYKPFAAIADLHPLMDTEERQAALVEDIEKNLTQICGRILRTKLPRIEGQVTQDPEKRVFALLNLPVELSGFELSQRLFHEYNEVSESWIRNDAKQAQSMADSILRVCNGEMPLDHQAIQRQEVYDKAKGKEGLANISPKKRSTIDKEALEQERAKKKEAATFERLKAKVFEMKKNGSSWKEVLQKLHVNRYPKFKDELRKVFDL